MTTTPRKPFPHGIDITAPGGIDALIEFHRQTFGEARMEATDDGQSDGDGGEGDQEDHGADNGAEGSEGSQDAGARRALMAERRAARTARQELAAAQARLKELEDASKTEEQRREDSAKELQSENASLKSENDRKDALLLRYEVAAAKGLDLKAASRLQGTTREEIEADAADWIRQWGSGSGTQPPQQDPGQGARSGQRPSSYSQGAERAKARFGDKK